MTVSGTPTTINYTYNAANQLTSGGATYDANGNMLNDGTSAYTWDRANRLLTMGGASYAYDGEGRRVKQTVGAVVTKYLLDLQPGLSVTLSETTGATVTQYVHAPRGILAQKDSSGSWDWMMQDGLGSVRAVADNTGGVLWNGSTAPYGDYFGEVGTRQSNYGFTGEYTDPVTGQVHLRARDYNPTLGVFGSLDPFEGIAGRVMSLNGYAWVEGNVVNAGDPSGMSLSLAKYLNSGHCLSWEDECARACTVFAGRNDSISSYLECLGACTPPEVVWARRKSLTYCESWPHDDHPLVYRLCRRCRYQTTPFPSYEVYSDEAAVIKAIETHNRLMCESTNLGDMGCKHRVAEIFGWLWSQPGEIGKRAVAGFIAGLDNYITNTKVSFISGGSAAQAGPPSIYNLNPILKLSQTLETASPKHIDGMRIVHEMEHFWYDSGYSGKTMGEVRAYLSGYLFMLELGYDDARIQFEDAGNDISPTQQVGNIYCHADPNAPKGKWTLFSQKMFGRLRQSMTLPQFGGHRNCPLD